MKREVIDTQDFRHTPDMGEISGFGGDYEIVCQDMLSAGVEWLLRQHKKDRKSGDANMARGGFKNVFGFLAADSDDEKYLSKVIVYASKGKCTDAMQGIIMQRLREIARIGWAEYCTQMRLNLAEREAREMSGGIEPVKIEQTPQPDWVVVEYTTTQGHFRRCLFSMRDAKDHWARCNDDIKSSYLIRDADPDDFEGCYHLVSKGFEVRSAPAEGE